MCSDAEIRPALRSRLESSAAFTHDAVIVEEMGICGGQVRADMALVNGRIHGFEIKSDRDTLRRFLRQVEYCSEVFDKMTIVVGDEHFDDVVKAVPDWWGILLVDSSSKRPRFRRVRHERKNPDRNIRALVELLWRDDALDLLESHGVSRGVRSKTRDLIWDRVCETVETKSIVDSVIEKLKARAACPTPQLFS